jgi:hypothetical protein
MSEVLSPEELAALFEGLREAEGGPGFLLGDLPEEIRPINRVFSERCRNTSFQNLSNWLMGLADLRWPHL